MSFSPTTTNLLTLIHIQSELDDEPPSSGDTDYTVRLSLLNKWIRYWEQEKGMYWDGLWTQGSITSTGTSSYVLSSSGITNFRFPGGKLYVSRSGGGTYWIDIIKPEDIILKKNDGIAYAYFLGDPANGYTLYFNPNSYPASGDTIYLPYYKVATQLSGAGDVTECPDPDYLVHGVVSDILSQEDPEEADRNFQIAQDKMAGMKLRNTMTAYYMENTITDPIKKLTNSGFGR